MTGHAFIVHESGWACSNDVFTDTESDVIVNEGKPSLRQTNTLKANAIFNGVGNVNVGFDVECVMIDEATGKQHGITGRVRKTGNLTVIDITGEITDTKSIIKKIK